MEKNKSNQIRVLIVKPELEPYETEIDNNYKVEQNIVGGTIDVIQFPTMKNVDIVVNDEFLNLKMQGNFYIPHTEQAVCGSAVITGYNPNNGESISLTDKQIKACKEYINYFRIPTGLDFYLDYSMIKPYMQSKRKLYDKAMKQKAEM